MALWGRKATQLGKIQCAKCKCEPTLSWSKSARHCYNVHGATSDDWDTEIAMEVDYEKRPGKFELSVLELEYGGRRR